ncbi:MAG: hypothetical protein ACI9BD_000230 [Candidatus Marinamargulisbacteria bacterium]|jgi:uncharacterized protein (DUF58 family)
MIPREVLKRIKALEIKTRQIVNTTFTGQYHSVFKGQGISFSEVREYQPGDEVRMIDWKVTARTGKPHIKVFEEERELTVILAVDLSASGTFGSQEKSKVQIAAEIAAVLGFSANNNNDRVGLMLFSDEVEHYIPPKKGRDHIFRILRDIFYFEPKSKRTSIKNAMSFAQRVLKKKAIIFVISDFVDAGYEQVMQTMARKHDLVPIIVEDPRELDIPKCGLVLFEDEETGEQIYLNTNSEENRRAYHNIVLARQLEQDRFFKSRKISAIRINIGSSYLTPLTEYFKLRAKRF